MQMGPHILFPSTSNRAIQSRRLFCLPRCDFRIYRLFPPLPLRACEYYEIFARLVHFGERSIARAE